jgi:hypothetical protein
MPATADSTRLARAFDWIKARMTLDTELAAMSRADLRLLANDIGVAEADLRDIVPRVRDHSDQMDKMMRARGLDPAAVRAAFSGVARDMEVTCARCRDAATCQRELDAGTARVFSHDFCPNAGTIDDLLTART